MIIYNKQEKIVIIPEGGGSTSFEPKPNCDELIAEAREEGYESGLTYGLTSGYSAGYSSGKTDGYEEGYDAGIIADCGEAIQESFEEGFQSGFTSAITKDVEIRYDFSYNFHSILGSPTLKINGNTIEDFTFDYSVWDNHIAVQTQLTDSALTSMELTIRFEENGVGVIPTEFPKFPIINNYRTFNVISQNREDLGNFTYKFTMYFNDEIFYDEMSYEAGYEKGRDYTEFVLVFDSDTDTPWQNRQVITLNGNEIEGAVCMESDGKIVVSALTTATTLSTLAFGVAHNPESLANPTMNGLYPARISSISSSGGALYTNYEIEFADTPISYDKNAFDYGFQSGQTHPVNLYFPMDYFRVPYDNFTAVTMTINGIPSDAQGCSWSNDPSERYIAISASTSDSVLNQVEFAVSLYDYTTPYFPEELPYDPIINDTITAHIVSQSRTTLREGLPQTYKFTVNFNSDPIYDEVSYKAGLAACQNNE